jgi:hypothetical protein
MTKNNEEFLNTVLATTREQLSNAVHLCAELEALLIMEKKKTSQLESMLEKKASDAKVSND